MGQRSRKRAETFVPGPTKAPRPPRPPRRSTDEKNAESRERLQPLRAGERPGPVTVAAAVAGTLALINLVLVLSGYELSDEDAGGPVGGLIFAAVLGAMTWGLWRAKYWAVLGFQALLAMTLIFSSLGLLVASNVLAVVLCLTVVGAGGYLFYRLVRSMARIQMPERR